MISKPLIINNGLSPVLKIANRKVERRTKIEVFLSQKGCHDFSFTPPSYCYSPYSSYYSLLLLLLRPPPQKEVLDDSTFWLYKRKMYYLDCRFPTNHAPERPFLVLAGEG